VEDIEQVLIVHVLSELSHTPGTVSKRQVINRSLKDCVSDMIRAAKAAKRGLGAEKLCLDDEPGSSGSSALDEWLGRCFRHESATRDIARQLAEIGMSSDERALADLLKEASLCEAAERLGISRWRARELVRSIREKWEHAENPPPIQRGCGDTSARAIEGASLNNQIERLTVNRSYTVTFSDDADIKLAEVLLNASLAAVRTVIGEAALKEAVTADFDTEKRVIRFSIKAPEGEVVLRCLLDLLEVNLSRGEFSVAAVPQEGSRAALRLTFIIL
jgi:hypothetical protein